MLFTKRWVKIAVAVIALAIASSFVIATMASATPSFHDQVSRTGSSFVRLLNKLSVDNRPTSHGGYQRTLFKVWGDGNGDGCNTRSDVLRDESSRPVTTGSTRCTVKTGRWWSAYDNIIITVASKLDIDHFVPLSEAWKSGAYKWSKPRRDAFANDENYPYSLIAVSASTNRSKSDQDPVDWMPPNRGYWWSYAATWVAVKYRWSLSVDASEKSTLTRILSRCGKIGIPIPDKA